MDRWRDALISHMRDVFGSDRRRIEHALRVTEFAEKLLECEGGDREVVVAAAVLHDIGIQAAEKNHGSAAGPYQELEGPPIARRILTQLGARLELIEEVCTIIGSHHSPGEVQTKNFDLVWDADWLVNLPEEQDLSDSAASSRRISKIFRTAAGRELASRLFLKER